MRSGAGVDLGRGVVPVWFRHKRGARRKWGGLKVRVRPGGERVWLGAVVLVDL